MRVAEHDLGPLAAPAPYEVVERRGVDAHRVEVHDAVEQQARSLCFHVVGTGGLPQIAADFMP